VKTKLSVYWMRRDLRLDDNHALYRALLEKEPVLPVFIFDTTILDQLENKEDRRVDFIRQHLGGLQDKLALKGKAIAEYHGKPLDIFKKLVQDYDVAAVYTNEDYEPAAIKRDAEIRDFLEGKNISFYSYKDQVIFAKDDVVKANGSPYSVYTPYSKKWLEQWEKDRQKPYPSERHLEKLLDAKFKRLSLKGIGFESTGGSWKVPQLTDAFLKRYAEIRNTPSEHTSELSVHLRFGTIGIRKLVERVGDKSEVFLKELIWREFFMQILYHFPKVVTHSFRAEYDRIPWENNEDYLASWQQGKTGYPLVDAGMRQLNKTGYMPNRVRMVCASFLTKHLLIDWRIGEAYFAVQLLDYDLSANNGNWQWCAGSGADASPYFRVFNPEEQQKKFDPEFIYIKKWVPEFNTKEYPEPIVEHKAAREKALNTYKKALQKS